MLVQPSGAFPQIPVTPTPQARGEIPCPRKESPLRVLVVDDEPLVLWSIAERLRAYGVDLWEAADARGALRILSSESDPPDVILLDLRLPDSSDLSLLTAMRGLAPAARVILMTAFGTPEVSDEARRLGAFAVIEKPFDLDDLEGLLARGVP